jgi:cyclin-dependent kinase regulatory subunit CKS1
MNEKRMKELADKIYYSDTYETDEHLYRHVILPHELAAILPKKRLLREEEWRGIGVSQSKGWMHYMIHTPEPHILLFKKPAPRSPTN